MSQIYKPGSGGGGGSVTITGDSGSISGANLTIYADLASANSGSTVYFSNSGTTSTFNLTDQSANTILGSGSGIVGTSSHDSAGVGANSLENLSSSAHNNYFLGNYCLSNLTTGISNIAIGYQVLNSAGTQAHCIAIGDNALFSLNAGSGFNIALGEGVLQFSVSDTLNVGIGYSALHDLNGTGTATKNTAIGAQSMNTASTSFNCVAVGYNSMQALGAGHSSTGVGYQALFSNSGSFNLGLGASVGSALTGSESNNVLLNSSGVSGDGNVLRIGQATGTGTQGLNKAFIHGIYSNTQPTSSTVNVVTIDNTTGQLGVTTSSGGVTLTGDTGTAISGNSLNVITGNASVNSGSSVYFDNDGSTTSTLNLTDSNANTLLGNNCGNLTVTGNSNTGAGAFSLNSLSSGIGNLCGGYGSGSAISTNSYNTNLGYNSGTSNSGGQQNSSLGAQTIQNLQSGDNNVSIGFQSLSGASAPFYNTIVGALSMGSLTTGSYNSTLGYLCGINYNSSESANILLNSEGVTGDNYTMRVGDITGTGLNGLNSVYFQGIYGNSQTPSGTVQYVTIDNTTGLLGVTSSGASGTSWTDKSSNFSAVGGNGYFVTATATASLSLAAAQGDTISFVNVSAGSLGFVVQAAAGQTITLGAASSSSGGTLSSTANGNSITLVYQSASSTWFAVPSPEGTWTVA